MTNGYIDTGFIMLDMNYHRNVSQPYMKASESTNMLNCSKELCLKFQ